MRDIQIRTYDGLLPQVNLQHSKLHFDKLPPILSADSLKNATAEDLSILRVLMLKQMVRGLEPKNCVEVIEGIGKGALKKVTPLEVSEYNIGNERGTTIDILKSSEAGTIVLDIDPAFGLLWHAEMNGEHSDDESYKRLTLPLRDEYEDTGDGQILPVEMGRLFSNEMHTLSAETLAQATNPEIIDMQSLVPNVYELLTYLFNTSCRISTGETHFGGSHHEMSLLAAIDNAAATLIVESEHKEVRMNLYLGQSGLRWVSFEGFFPDENTRRGQEYRRASQFSDRAKNLGRIIDRFYPVELREAGMGKVLLQ